MNQSGKILLVVSCDRKFHRGLPEIPLGCAALTGITRDSDAVGGAVQEEVA